jgi:hypothetical protein
MGGNGESMARLTGRCEGRRMRRRWPHVTYCHRERCRFCELHHFAVLSASWAGRGKVLKERRDDAASTRPRNAKGTDRHFPVTDFIGKSQTPQQPRSDIFYPYASDEIALEKAVGSSKTYFL